MSEFRDRLIAGNAEQLLLEVMVECFKEKGLLNARGRQRTDSSHVLAAVRVLHRLECVGETVRHALTRLAVAVPDWLALQRDPAWADRYGPRVDAYRLPKKKEERQALAAQIGQDGVRLLGAVYGADAPPELRLLPAVETLRQVWIQQSPGGYPIAEEVVHWRANDAIPPSSTMISSPHDRDARYAVTRHPSWTGDKSHRTETCDADSPQVITHVETTVATEPDAQLPPIHEALARKELLPSEHIIFAAKDCLACPRRADCTSSATGPRHSTIRPREQHEVLQTARQEQQTAEFKAEDDVRAGVEGTVSQGLRVCALRHARSIGLATTRLQHVLTAAALTVIRITHWLEDPHLAKTRRAPFLALLPAAA